MRWAKWAELHPAGDSSSIFGIAVDIKVKRWRTKHNQRRRLLGQNVSPCPQKRIAKYDVIRSAMQLAGTLFN